MDRGYVKLWRKSIDSDMLKNHALWAFWCWCLLKATHKPVKQMVGFVEVELLPGQLLFGRRKAASELNISEQTVRTCLKTLKATNNIAVKTTNKFSIISIVNWDSYQCQNQGGQPANQPPIQPTTNQQLTNNQPTTNHKQEHKNIRNYNNTSSSIKTSFYGEKPKQTQKRGKKFVKPTVEEIRAYCIERRNNIDPEYFFDNYERNGWTVGKASTKMKDWKATVRTWEKNEYDTGRTTNGRQGGNGNAGKKNNGGLPQTFGDPEYYRNSGTPYDEKSDLF